MFQISRRADYATRIMLELGLLGERERISSRHISRKTGVPKAFLHKITADLVKANLVATYAGPAGGLMLRRPLDQINLLQVLEAVEGPICLNICLLDPDECSRQAVCPAHDFWGELQINIAKQLQEMTLEKLVEEAHELKKNPRPRPDLIAQDDIEIRSE